MRLCVVAVAAFLLAPLTAAADTAPAGKLVAATGRVELNREGGQWTPAGILDPVFQGQSIKTGGESKAKILLSDQSVVMIGENSEIEVSEFADSPGRKSSIVTIFKGRIMAVISKLASGGNPAEFRTPTAVAGVRGTMFAIDVTDDEGKTEIMVAGGVINVRNILDPDGAGVDIGPGLMTTVMPGVQPSPPVPFDAEKWRSFLSSLRQSLMTGANLDTKTINSDILAKLTPPKPREDRSKNAVSPLVQPPQLLPPVLQETAAANIPVPVHLNVNMPNASADELKKITGK